MSVEQHYRKAMPPVAQLELVPLSLATQALDVLRMLILHKFHDQHKSWHRICAGYEASKLQKPQEYAMGCSGDHYCCTHLHIVLRRNGVSM